MALPFTVALCCNGSLLPGLHATLASMTRCLSEREKVALHIFFREIDPESREDLRRTVKKTGGVADMQFHEVELAEFQVLRSLHGDQMTYLKLKLAELLPDVSRILYLDSDLVVNLDVCQLFSVPIDNYVLGAVAVERIRWSTDRDFLVEVGLDEDGGYFNAGVLFFNATLWRAEKMTERTLEFARAHPTSLKCQDQTVLNATCARTFLSLPERFNGIVQPQGPRVETQAQVYHFLGSPKPWDPMGRLMHSNFHIWDEAIRQSCFSWSDFLRRHGRFYASRTWALRKSYLRELKLRAMAMMKGRNGG